MSLADIPELLELFESGTYGETDVLFILSKLTAREDIDALLASLPEPWRQKFSTWMIETHDNDLPASSFIMLDSAAGEVPEKALIISRIREWIARNRAALGS